MQLQLLKFDGGTFDFNHDSKRLTPLLHRVKECLGNGRWWTLRELQERCGGSEASVSARIRDLRKERFGGHKVERQRMKAGVWIYRMVRDESQVYESNV